MTTKKFKNILKRQLDSIYPVLLHLEYMPTSPYAIYTMY